ncbi:hypothetical protein ATO13_21966 [Stappia sp. 22II-S9-Z10]|nr:hypothetical protein ATO13_21966 [Stappia sp. 22II-S9-Z10]
MASRNVAWHEFVVKLGDGDSPEVFAAPCGLTSKGFQGTTTNNEYYPVDCDDPAAATDAVRSVYGKSRTITGEGQIKSGVVATWDDWYESAEAKNCQVHLVVPAGDGGVYWQGPFILSNFTINGARDGEGILMVSVEMQSAGPITRSAQPA